MCGGASAPDRAPAAPGGDGTGGRPRGQRAAEPGTQDGGQGGGSGGETGPRDGGSGGTTSAVLPDTTKLVYHGTLRVEVEDVDAAVKAGRQIVDRLGGYLAGSRQTRHGDQHVASITYRIPAEQWEEALERLRGLGTMVGEETDAEEVTSQLVDLEARIRNLRASEAAVQRLTQDATGVEQLLDVEARLSGLRGQIEQLEAQRESLSDRAAFGTLTVTFANAGGAIAAAADDAPAWDAGRDVMAATTTLVGMLEALTSAGIWLGIVWLPILLAVLVVVLVVRAVLRRAGLGPEAHPAGSVRG